MTVDSLSIQEQANRLYRGKGLAPMVRASTTPLRTLALEYGADLLYTDELVDRSLSQTIRCENKVLGTIDYVKDMSKLSQKAQRKLEQEDRPCLIVRIDPKEQSKLVCQIGTGEPELALEAAQHVYQDFAAIDINMGCPKKFSVSGGMGSALLSDPKRAARIISTLRQAIPRPISCKIRLLSTAEKTVDFVEQMMEAGVNAVTIHARRVGHDATKPADWKTLETVVQQLRDKHPSFPFLLNGDFYDRTEIQHMLETTKANGVLLGRPALYNTSIFLGGKETVLVDKTQVIQRYLQHAARYDIHFKNPKYVVCEMMNNRRAPSPRVPQLPQIYPGGQTIGKTCSCTSLKQLFELWNMEWKGVGKAAMEDQNDNAVVLLAESDMAPGEQRYDDAYFAESHKRQQEDPSNDTNDTSDQAVPEHKRPRLDVSDNEQDSTLQLVEATKPWNDLPQAL